TRAAAQVATRSEHVVELARALGAVVERLAELHPVGDPTAVVDGQDDVAAAREVLVQRVRVAVVIEVVPTQEHLTPRAAVEEDHGGSPVARLDAAWQKQLSGKRPPVRRGEEYRLWVH